MACNTNEEKKAVWKEVSGLLEDKLLDGQGYKAPGGFEKTIEEKSFNTKKIVGGVWGYCYSCGSVGHDGSADGHFKSHNC